jgi:hypothetical protein
MGNKIHVLMQECVVSVYHIRRAAGRRTIGQTAFSALILDKARRKTRSGSFDKIIVQQRNSGPMVLGLGKRNAHMLSLLFVCDAEGYARFETQDLASIVAFVRIVRSGLERSGLEMIFS